MAATVRKLVSRREKVSREKSAGLRDAVLAYQHDIPFVREWIAQLDRETAARNGWTFIMISADQHDAVVEWLEAKSLRPMKAMRLWSLLFTRVDRDTGEVMLTRDEMAQRLNIGVQHVSDIMTELEGIGAISRHRQRVAGMRGPGMVRYFMNPVVGTHLAGRARDEAQAAAPKLRVMEGGKAT